MKLNWMRRIMHGGRVFQSLEKWGANFPMFGKYAGFFSNHWKTLAAGLALLSATPARAQFIGWACGGMDGQGGVLLCTTNGVDWFRQGVGQMGTTPLGGVAAVNGRHVWVVGDPANGYASIYYSPNAGESWVRQGSASSLPDQPLHKIWAVDRNVLWAVGVGGSVVVTDNGGADWHDVSLAGFSMMLQGVTAVDQYRAWVSGEENPETGAAGLFYTENSGQYWLALTNGAVTNTGHLLGLAALDENRVWAIGGEQTIIVTTNAGADWSLLHKGMTIKDGNEICVLDEQQIWTANDAVLLWTTNGGASWESEQARDFTMDVSTPDGTNIWAVSSGYWGGTIYHSADGGATWTNLGDVAGLNGLTTLEVQRAPVSRTLHVDAASSNATPPYNSWATAASNIQDAVDAAAEGDLVLVGDGVYHRGGATPASGKILNRVMLDKPITVMSLNGPEAAIIEGAGPNGNDAVRGAFLSQGATLSGFTITNGHVLTDSGGLGVDLTGGGIHQYGSCLVSNCVITGNSGSGVLIEYSDDVLLLGPPRLLHSTVRGNAGLSGGGIVVDGCGEISHCQILDNQSFGVGGGVHLSGNYEGQYPLLLNCFIAGNRVLNEQGDNGGGVLAEARFLIRHCTVVENTATDAGGGLHVDGGEDTDSEVANTIIFNNHAPAGSNAVITSADVRACWLDKDPALLGIRNPHIALDSSCRFAGDTNGITAGDTDIDGEPRMSGGNTDIGCDQYVPGYIMGGLSAEIIAPYTAVLTGVPLAMAADITGKAFWQFWHIETNGGVRVVSNTVHVTQTWPVQGIYTVRLEAVNQAMTASTTLVVHVTEPAEHYVSPGGGNLYPYTNWAMAATSLIEAVQSCPAGGVLHIGTGTYAEADSVSLSKPLSLLGMGPATAIRVDGQQAFPCFYVNHPLAVLSNLTLLNGRSPSQGGGAYLRDGLITHCHVISNYAFEQGGGLSCWGSAKVERCFISGNEAGKWGGGLMANEDTLIRDCYIQNNNAHNYGGGANISDRVGLQNCFLAGNRAFGGAGVHLDGGGTAQNCTILKNKATDNGGGILHRFADVGATYNCIVYHNEAPVGPNINFQVGMTGIVEHTCSWPWFAGPGNITNEPCLLGLDNPHIVAASPCINAGDTGLVAGLEQDIDGEARIQGATVDMGCDEFIATNILGPLFVNILGEFQVVAGDGADLYADIRGKALDYAWTVADAGDTSVYPHTFMIAPAWTQAGWYDVILSASNLEESVSATATVHVIEGGFTNYVSPNGAHIAPFTNWADAATNVQAAIDACWVGGVVLVDTGSYVEGRAIELNKPIAVMGVGAPEDSILDGDMGNRVININHERALLANVGVTMGMDADAAGVYMLEGTVSNCVIAGNISMLVGGGIRCAGNSLLTDSRITANTSMNWPGGVFCSGRATVRHCTIEENTAQGNGGGVYIDQGGLVTGCLIQANSAVGGGGVYLHYAGTVTHSILHSNVSANGAGAFLYWGGVVTNCDITWNWGQFDGGGLWFNFGGLVTDSRVQNNFADENAGAGGGAVLAGGGILRRCDVSTNRAADGAGIYSQYSAQNGGMIDACHIHHNLSPEGWGDGMSGGVTTYNDDIIRNCLIENNTCSNMIGGLLLGRNCTALNCTIANNTAGDKIGGVAISAGAEMNNCVFYGNTAPLSANWEAAGGITVERCCTTPDAPGFSGTITMAPAFAGAGDYRLQSNSPCVNAGRLDYWMSGAGDIAGNPRVQSGMVDVGAYESPWWGMYADVDEDDFTDWTEVNITGTDPTNSSSYLQVSGFSFQDFSSSGLVVRWASVAGKFYNVDRATNLLAPPPFTNLMTGVTGQSGFTTVTDTTATAEGPYFYRVGMGP